LLIKAPEPTAAASEASPAFAHVAEALVLSGQAKAFCGPIAWKMLLTFLPGNLALHPPPDNVGLDVEVLVHLGARHPREDASSQFGHQDVVELSGAPSPPGTTLLKENGAVESGCRPSRNGIVADPAGVDWSVVVAPA